MLQSRRRRRYSSPVVVSGRFSVGYLIRMLVILAIAATVAWGALRVVGVFLPAAHGHKAATILAVGKRGRVDVVLGNEEAAQRAEDGLRLYEGDTVRTNGSASASLYFFDKSLVKLDANTEIFLSKASILPESAAISLIIKNGNVFIDAGTGTYVSRALETSNAKYVIPPRTRAIIGNSLYVFATSGPGVTAKIPISSRTSEFVVVGEGQQLVVDGIKIKKIREEGMDPYELRGVLGSEILSSPFYLAATSVEPEIPIPRTSDIAVGGEDREMLTIDEPEDGAVLQGSTFIVKGSVGKRVAKVNVNGYLAELDGRRFLEEIAMPAEENFSVDVSAEDRDGLIVAEKSISLSHDLHPPDPPVITKPGGSGDTIQVSEDVFEIVGTSSPGTVGIEVNGYQLQKYRPAGIWQYLVDPKLGNVQIGENKYTVVAIDRSGNRSDPAVIKIIWKAQPVPMLLEGSSDRDASTYLAPGTIKVTAPTGDGTKYVSDKDEITIEGETSPETYSISINGFTLTLYKPGKTTWNYIAKRQFGNYHYGVNKYTIVARNKSGKILDVLRYLIEKR